MFFTMNHDSLRLWFQENFIKHQKVSKCYDKDYLKNFLLLFLSLLTASVVKNSHFLARIYFIFLRIVTDQTSNVFYTKFGPQ